MVAPAMSPELHEQGNHVVSAGRAGVAGGDQRSQEHAGSTKAAGITEGLGHAHGGGRPGAEAGGKLRRRRAEGWN